MKVITLNEIEKVFVELYKSDLDNIHHDYGRARKRNHKALNLLHNYLLKVNKDRIHVIDLMCVEEWQKESEI